jgi:MscS family membrane protein
MNLTKRTRAVRAALPRAVAPASSYPHTLAFILALTLFGLSPGAAAQSRPTVLPEKEEAALNEGLELAPSTLDRSTPRKSFASLLASCGEGQYAVAAHLLNLGDVAKADQGALGVSLASQLCAVLRAVRMTSADRLDDTTTGPLLDGKPQNFVVAARLKGPSGLEELWLRRIRDRRTKTDVWVATRESVSMTPDWYRTLVKKEMAGRTPVEMVNRGLGALPAGDRLESPRATASLFVRLCSAGDFAGAAHLLDLAAIAPDRQRVEGSRLARRLGLVLKKAAPAGFGRLSNDPAGAPERDVPYDEEVVTKAPLGGQDLQIRLARFLLKGRAPVWLFSEATVADIDALYTASGYGWVGDHLPTVFFEWELVGIQLWQWVGLLAALCLAILLGIVAASLARRLLQRLTSMTRWSWDDALVASTRGALALGFTVLIFDANLPFLALGQRPHDFLLAASKLAGILALGWFLLRLVDLGADLLHRFFKDRQDDMGLAMVPVTRKMLKPILAGCIGIVALQNMGMNVAGLLAGLGIGGLAIALAGKTALENLFGSLTIAFDRPFKIGDTVKVAEFFGTVEDVGLRSTKLRTLDRTLVTVPNAQMADAKVENYSARDRIRLLQAIGVQYDTTMDQLRLIVDETKRYLLAHPRVYRESPFSVRFVGYGASSLDLQVICYITTSDFGEFTGIREEILMTLFGIVARAGASFAFPSQTLYTAEQPPPDAAKAREAADLVATRLAAGELCLPEIPDKVQAEIRPPTPS